MTDPFQRAVETTEQAWQAHRAECPNCQSGPKCDRGSSLWNRWQRALHITTCPVCLGAARWNQAAQRQEVPSAPKPETLWPEL